MEQIDVVVIGAGVTGLAAARRDRRRGASVCVLERHRAPGPRHEHAQQRRHPRGHLLSRRLAQGAAVRGRPPPAVRVLRGARRAHLQSGKLIVAADESEVPALAELKARGDANGVEGLEIVDRAFVTKREPAVSRRSRRSTLPKAGS